MVVEMNEKSSKVVSTFQPPQQKKRETMALLSVYSAIAGRSRTKHKTNFLRFYIADIVHVRNFHSSVSANNSLFSIFKHQNYVSKHRVIPLQRTSYKSNP